ncbi:unnamed protein product [Rotaria sp. Silwood2]|nr:unnamed protein product [Rotaria sp. Silwood2]CAF4558994.1 unnamed protein product [Rotaria sp. Silwood2]
MSLRFFNIKLEDVDEYLKSIGFMTAKTSHKWATVFLKGDYEEFSTDLRGGKQTDSFYDTFPEIEADAKAFVVQACLQKLGEFKALNLVWFVDEKYYELTGIKKQIGNDYIRSKRSCRVDLRRWRAKFEANSQRLYFEGHERNDIVKYRSEFIGYFLSHKDFYYSVIYDEIPMWQLPTQNPPRILIFHDESTFRSDEVRSKRWFFKQNTPTFSRGHGRSHMILDFLIQHPSEPFFELSEDEWKQAEFGKNIGTRCPVEQIDGAVKVIDCYFKHGENKDKSKGLVELCKELGVQLPAKVKLQEICEIRSNHRAFQNIAKLEMLAVKYNINIIFCPKYHCELNAIEGLWCCQKAYVRSRTNQTFEKMIKSISESRINFIERLIALKLCRRFWHAIEAYSKGQTYANILKLFFSQFCKTTAQSHRTITNTNIDEN